MASETRQWPDGSTITRDEAIAEGYQWSIIMMYTEPVEADNGD